MKHRHKGRENWLVGGKSFQMSNLSDGLINTAERKNYKLIQFLGDDGVCYLTGVLASLQEARTDHVLRDLERISVEAGVITQQGGFQTL